MIIENHIFTQSYATRENIISMNTREINLYLTPTIVYIFTKNNI